MTIKGNEIFYEFDPFELTDTEKPSENLSDAVEDIKNFVLDSVLDSVGEARSPVSGYGKFKGLNKDYKKIKGKQSSSVIANLELTGDMLDALEVVEVKDRLRIRIKGSESGKADGHNNHSGKSRLPTRRFIPGSGETFKRDIISGIKEIVGEYATQEPDTTVAEVRKAPDAKEFTTTPLSGPVGTKAKQWGDGLTVKKADEIAKRLRAAGNSATVVPSKKFPGKRTVITFER